MPKFLLIAAAVGLSVGGASAVVPVVPGKQIANHLGEQHLHAALKATHAAAKAEKAGNTQAARADAQAAIQSLHAAAKAFDQHHKASAGKSQHHPTHPHIQAALHDLQAAEKVMAAGNVAKAEKDFHKAATQIQDAIKAHQQRHRKK